VCGGELTGDGAVGLDDLGRERVFGFVWRENSGKISKFGKRSVTNDGGKGLIY
jgi:hypothetical protein